MGCNYKCVCLKSAITAIPIQEFPDHSYEPIETDIADSDDTPESARAEQALFWLAHSGSEAAFEFLETLF
ncbi:MAG: hypothetical protein OEU90_09655 [Gammaproteobacteria bacterium]|nr:hypothetical protein [Gammaproteobacteria bacterium]MDH3805722.1 hypothetical protein [Gammaproteobacteria bacterium]